MRCFNCGMEIDDDSKFCIECGVDLVHPNFIGKSHTHIYFDLAIVVLILGFIGGIASGFMFPIKTGYIISREEFNIGMMLYCWIGSSIFALLIFAIYSICHRLDLLIDKK